MKYLKIVTSSLRVHIIPFHMIRFQCERKSNPKENDKYMVCIIVDGKEIVCTAINSPDKFIKRCLDFENGCCDVITFKDLVDGI